MCDLMQPPINELAAGLRFNGKRVPTTMVSTRFP
jgi:hypothetical protein